MRVQDYLYADNKSKQNYWREGWNHFKNVYKSDIFKEKNIILSIHGVLVGSVTGSFCSVDIPSIMDFKPTKIITLIDDVYASWYRTEERAQGIQYIGQPSLEELLDARRSEILVGDIIQNHIEPTPPHFILATRHTARTLFRLCFLNTSDLETVYLSFPISGPRRLLNEGDESGINDVNDFLREANNFEEAHNNFACFCPLCIDELPLIMKGEESDEGWTFDLTYRWEVRDFYSEEILLGDFHTIPGILEFPDKKKIRYVEGLIRTDVGWRDHRLVKQSKHLVVFNPVYLGHLSGGVDSEIDGNIMKRKHCFVYQNPEHDPQGLVKSRWVKEDPSIPSPGMRYVTIYDNLNELFQALGSW